MDYTGLKVLILEDDEQQTNIYSQIFDDLGIEILISNNLYNLKKIIDEFKPQILLVDLMFDSDPFNTLAGLKVKEYFDPSKCIICSGLLDNSAITKCNNEGFFMIIKKPATKDKLVRCLDMLWSVNSAKLGLFNMIDTKYRTLQEQEIILNSINAGAYIKDKDLKYITVNKVFLDMIGLSRDDVIGKTDQDFVTNQYKLEKFIIQDNYIMTHKKPISDIIEFTNYNNQVRWTNTFKSPYINDAGDVEEIIGFIIDITNLVQVKQLFDVTFDAILDGIIIINSDFQVTHCNKSIRNLHYDKIPIIGNGCYDLYGCSPEDINHNCLAKKTFRTGQVNQIEKLLNNRWYDIRYYPIKTGNDVTSVVITQRDIHEIKIREKRLEYRISLERMLVRISSRFSSLRIEDIDNSITTALAEICKFFNVPIACIFQIDEDQTRLTKTHDYHLEYVTPTFNVGDSVSIECIGSSYLKLLQGETIIGDNIKQEKTTKISCLMHDLDVSSSLLIPITGSGNVDIIGFMCVDNANQFSWDGDTVGVFQVIGEIFASSITRRTLERELFKERERKENELTIALNNWKDESKNTHNKTRDNIRLLSTILDEVTHKKDAT